MNQLTLTNNQFKIRHAEAEDYNLVNSIINDWWGGRAMRDMLPKLFFVHFQETSFVAESDNQLIGFLIGFFSQTYSDQAYIHFVGVHPEFRRHRIGKALYECFFNTVLNNKRNLVYCVTSPVNKLSIEFHHKMGFYSIPSQNKIDGVFVHCNYDGFGEDRVLFCKQLVNYDYL
ncbi:GNAT family N-acetyltransferase [Nostoc minutum NIES-26]|uniref:GNAT family N-acetyltransferase n=1 Tax=Nostoc minutum NIES-26 TaxID=1844469 RepID=A0A367S3F2_9NOSO|nr:GNAT family N-acetyltransferase [Nostoc minutum NIES-26]